MNEVPKQNLFRRPSAASTAFAGDIADRVREDGYAIIEELLTPDELTAIRGALDPWLKGKHMGRNDFEGYKTERVYAMLAKSPVFATIVEHPVTLPILEQLLAPHFLLSALLAIYLHPGETIQNWHNDNAGGGGADRTATHGVSTMWAISDFTEENGATELIPGSHRWTGERPEADDPRSIQALMPAGSVMIWSGSLYHRGGANESASFRLGITPQFCQPWLRQLENMTLAVPPEIAGQHSERVQELLGYSIREPGFMGYVDGLHPKRLINPDYRGRKDRGLPS